MAPKVAAILVGYLALWLAIAAAGIYFAMAYGAPFWVAALAAFLVFGLLNGTLAYLGRARQMRERGEVPPPYLVYLLNPKPNALGFGDKVAVPRIVRVLVGIVFLLVGGLLAIAGFAITFSAELQSGANPIIGRLVLSIVAAIGLGTVYVGWRLVIVTNEEPLFGKKTP